MPNYVTKETHQRIKAECEGLRRRLTQQTSIVRQAIESGGGTHDNAMYDSALQEQAVLAERVQQMEKYLTHPVFIDDLDLQSDAVSIGKFVLLKDVATKELTEYLILGSADKEYSNNDKVISYASPLAKQLLGKSEGDVVEVVVPSGTYELEVIKVKPYK
jgi:transcription elongation factor GreA